MPWQYDTNLSKVEWVVQYLGIAVIKGNFKEVQAVLNFEDPDPTKWSVEATIDAASFSSGGYGRMEDHVRGPEFLGVEEHPTVTFKSKRIEKADGRYRLAGDLTLHGVTREVVLDGVYGGEAADANGRVKRGLSGHTTVKRSDFGIKGTMSGPIPTASEEVQVTIEVIANKVE